ncbi:MAG: hypothetical protein Q9177_000287 [Variospora cf. flavescens]
MSLLPMSTKDETYEEESTSRNSKSLQLHPAFYVATWMILSSAVILFNKWILDRAKYQSDAAILLTCYHLTFATITTQILARFSTMLNGRHLVRMTPKLYVRAIVPIGVLYSLSLVCSNLPYLYLSVAFIQMLKGTAPIFVFLALCSLRLSSPTVSTSLNLLIIVFGVVLASLGEIRIQLMGFLFQFGGLVFEAYRLALIQKLLNDERYKMDPLVSLYYFAPCCAGMIALMGVGEEWPSISWEDVQGVGWWVWAANGMLAMALNVASVFLVSFVPPDDPHRELQLIMERQIGKTSSLVLTLCGVAKSISLIGASMVIWGTVVTPIQFFGNGIAMAGLVYYNTGGAKVQSMADGVQSRCTRFWQQRSGGAKVGLAAGLVMLGLGIVGGVVVGCGGLLNLKDYWTVGALHRM